MKIYLAAAWPRREEIAAFAKELENSVPQVQVNARWLFEEPDTGDREYWATVDRDNVKDCDLLVRFTDDRRQPLVPSRLITGSRMWETGYAYALGKPIIVIGGHQPIFDWLPEIIHLENKADLIAFLKGAHSAISPGKVGL